jgi:hypothetical protein
MQMATVASLFADQAEATRALDAIADSPFAEVETRVIEPALDDTSGVDATLGGQVLQEIIAPFADTELTDLDDEARQWYAQGLRSGGTLVVAKVENERAAELEQFFARFGGRTSKNH